MYKAINSKQVPEAVGPYSHGAEFGNLVITSGQLPIDAATGEIPATAAEQARVSLENVKKTLEEAGSSMKNVMKTTVFVSDLNNFAAINEVYASFFSAPFPARSCVEVARLPKDVFVEIEALALK
ncbi:Rid family detoxifying hydrolase [Halodesulfovibrio aestuarii]|uniref:2-iminobutanoate/2-iminopropanoate deaminase n=1 Tax=Halodesulfovibrio aestuarii TaxID=126333 RepID=A0A8G2FBE5_9BACT|nr:Rid family detoxifying hydrolase [Halodesulfovibrio aestuarii]SHJ31593.1 2-iminobutanoate/2-iminopropanoate deaminase [Halodesulfovibrio aestuarii]